MPIYEYRCASCGFQNEYLQKVSDPVLTKCPECSADAFRKMLTAAGFQLKGSGWYATDFKSAGAKPDAKKEGTKTADATGGDAGASKSDAKSQPAPACGAGACPSCS